jgi:hypothetical protein
MTEWLLVGPGVAVVVLRNVIAGRLEAIHAVLERWDDDRAHARDESEND